MYVKGFPNQVKFR